MALLDLQRLQLGACSDPTNTTDPAIFQPASILGTNDNYKGYEWVFGALSNAAQPTVNIAIHGEFNVPQNYSAATTDPIAVIDWKATILTGNVVWAFRYRVISGDDTTSVDQATWQQTVSVTDAAPTTTDFRLQAVTGGMTRANFAAGDLVQFEFARLGADAGDTMAGSASLRNLRFRYADV